MDPERRGIKGAIIDRGGVRGTDGRLINQEHIGKKSQETVTLNHVPPACDETTLEQALTDLKKLQDFPDSAS